MSVNLRGSMDNATPQTPLVDSNRRTHQQQRIHDEGMQHLQAQDDEIKNKCLFCCCVSSIFCIFGPCILHEYICGE